MLGFMRTDIIICLGVHCTTTQANTQVITKASSVNFKLSEKVIYFTGTPHTMCYLLTLLVRH